MYIKKPRAISVFYCLEFSDIYIKYREEVSNSIKTQSKAIGSVALCAFALFIKFLYICCIIYQKTLKNALE